MLKSPSSPPSLSSDILPQIWLASQSPRRKALLEALGIPFLVRVSPIEEAHPNKENVEQTTMGNAYLKASTVAAQLNCPRDIVIGADTLVVADDEVLGK